MTTSPRWIADEYHTASCNSRFLQQSKRGVFLNYDSATAEAVRTAPLQRHDRQAVSLHLAVDTEPISVGLEETIIARRSWPSFSSTPLPFDQLAKILYLANGIRRDGSEATGNFRRNVANAGNLGSVELYCLARNVEAVESGLYHFHSLDHRLDQLKTGDHSTWLKERVFVQSEFADASVLLILTSAVGRLCGKYGIRGYRLALLDAGHVSQNVYLVATALGLNACATGGFVDCELNNLLGLDGLDTCVQLVIGISPSD